MLGFIIPIKPKRFSRDWDQDNLLLERTLKSMLQQTDKRFKIFIIYNEKPEIKIADTRINWIHFEFDFIQVEGIEDYESLIKKWYSPDYATKMFDKGRKIMYGCRFAIEAECNYLMAVDSDDLVSNGIVSLVNNQTGSCAGWVVRKGYMHIEGTRFFLKNRAIQNINGSTHIVRSDLVKLPDMKSRLFVDFNFFEAHGYLYQRIIDVYNQKLSTLPFYGIVYVIHSNNSSGIKEILSLNKIKTILKIILRGRFINKSLKNTFGIYKI